ncbi:hypothetical protein ACFOQM_10760 [Paenibacillus sp. GCM10012307]|uniref:Uncharacterized protein n=1 Tax=Paenibacillus roseus TaxID=2798579 RepID=A0A934ML42_9BACL|nr:hypothetical protein [Paenibacillus roseus]MBJ6361765.1 hypothetical protein [Paenibacillus roseus]
MFIPLWNAILGSFVVIGLIGVCLYNLYDLNKEEMAMKEEVINEKQPERVFIYNMNISRRHQLVVQERPRYLQREEVGQLGEGVLK